MSDEWIKCTALLRRLTMDSHGWFERGIISYLYKAKCHQSLRRGQWYLFLSSRFYAEDIVERAGQTSDMHLGDEVFAPLFPIKPLFVPPLHFPAARLLRRSPCQLVFGDLGKVYNMWARCKFQHTL